MMLPESLETLLGFVIENFTKSRFSDWVLNEQKALLSQIIIKLNSIKITLFYIYNWELNS